LARGPEEAPQAPNVEDHRLRLLEEREALVRHSASETEGRRPVELDQQSVGRLSRMDAMQVQAMAMATEQRRQLRVRQIDAALKRIEDGEFGYCLGCGEPIPEKRLAIDPASPRCVRCAR